MTIAEKVRTALERPFDIDGQFFSSSASIGVTLMPKHEQTAVDLLREANVPIDAQTGIPNHDSRTLETSEPGIFIAGVVVAGFDANRIFIENGRYHGDRIVARLLGQSAPSEPKLSAELDT